MTARDRIRHIVVTALCATALPAFGDALPSWNEGEAESSGVDFFDDGPQRGWLIVDMERDWARVYPYDP